MGETTDATRCYVCGEPFAAERVWMKGRPYHQRCSYVSADIVQELRALNERKGDMPGWPDQAANEIESLRAKLREAHQDKLALWEAIAGGPGPQCRDCADFSGRCQGNGLPCDPQARALEQIATLRTSVEGMPASLALALSSEREKRCNEQHRDILPIYLYGFDDATEAALEALKPLPSTGRDQEAGQ